MKNHSGNSYGSLCITSYSCETVMQSGSYNDEFGFKNDFTFNRNITADELKVVENEVINKINGKYDREVYFCSMDDAVNKYKALAFFTEKYDDIVRVVKFGSGLFRVKCLTSNQAITKYLQEQFDVYFNGISNIFDKYNELNQILKDSALEAQIKEIKNIAVSKDNLITIKDKTDNGNFIVVSVSKELQDSHSAIEIFKSLPEQPKGGGNPSLAQGIIDNATKIANNPIGNPTVLKSKNEFIDANGNNVIAVNKNARPIKINKNLFGRYLSIRSSFAT
ncbi:hypothetical protein FQA39_LY12981 [Lamprigera yunnana]|nr:hypothetical protein FQA39_LY12981 [Lamprigera yunnana]